MVLLRDGRTLIGYLRSVDQFANLVLHKSIERIHVGKEYGDIPRGIFIIRGENVVLLGEIVRLCRIHCNIPRYFVHWKFRLLSQDKEKEEHLPLTEVSVDEILDAQRREQQSKTDKHKMLSKALKERGLNMMTDLGHDDMYWSILSIINETD